LRVLFPFVGDSVGGSHRSIFELYNTLRSGPITPVFVLHKIGPLSELLDDLKIKYELLPVKYLAGNSPHILKIFFSIVFSFFKIRKFIRKNEIDLVHGNDLRINLTWSLSTRLSGALYLWHQRSLMSSSVLWRLSPLLANHFVTISKFVHQSLPENIPKSKKTLVLNPFNTEEIYEKEESRAWINSLHNIPEKNILFGYIGRLVDWKNVDFLIKCFVKYIRKRNFNLHLVIVGSGNNEYVNILKELVDELMANDAITFTGFNSEPSRVISAFDLMIAPSNHEPFGRTLVEAMIQKTPVLAAYGGGHSEIINAGVTGKLYHHNDVDDFINQCDNYLNNSSTKHRIINKAYDTASLKYSSYGHSRNIVKIYKQLSFIA